MNLRNQAKLKTGTKDNNAPNVTVKDILIGNIKIKSNIRKNYTEIKDLKKSIERHGLLQPIKVYPEGDDYIVKTGHRRFLAVSKLYEESPDRFHEIRCIITHPNDIESTQIVENIQRENLKAIELYESFKKLKEQNLTNIEIAEIISKDIKYVNRIFTAINDLDKNPEIIETMNTFPSVNMEDVIGTKAIKNKKKRLKTLEEKGQGKITRKELRKKAKPKEPEKQQTKKNRQINWQTNDIERYIKLSFVDDKTYKLIAEKLKTLLQNKFEINQE